MTANLTAARPATILLLFEPLPWTIQPRKLTPPGRAVAGGRRRHLRWLPGPDCSRVWRPSQTTWNDFGDLVSLRKSALRVEGSRPSRPRELTTTNRSTPHTSCSEADATQVWGAICGFATRWVRFLRGLYRHSLMSRLDRSASAKATAVPLASMDATCTAVGSPSRLALAWLCQQPPMCTCRPLDGHIRTG